MRGWTGGAPPLAIEYAGIGNDEGNLQTKIAELFEAGTQIIWVVRLVGERRVEVYIKGDHLHEVFHVGQDLVAPGILKNPVPVLAMFDRTAALEVTLTNLLQRAGYESLDHVRAEGIEKGKEVGREEGREEGREVGRERGKEEGKEETRKELRSILVLALESRGFAMGLTQSAQVASTRELGTLRRWIARALRATSVDEVFRESDDPSL